MNIALIIPKVRFECVSLTAYLAGQQALPGTIGGALLTAGAFAERGHELTIYHAGGRLEDSDKLRLIHFSDTADLVKAMSRSDHDVCIWRNMGSVDALPALAEAGMCAWPWCGNPLPVERLELIRANHIAGMVMVSDTLRMGFRPYPESKRVLYVHNPLHPAFTPSLSHRSPQQDVVVFTGHLSESKGAHRLLQTWAYVRRQAPTARLVIVGTRRLYGDHLAVGPRGLAAPEFEASYIQPLEDEFDSLDAAGVEFAGLLSPLRMRHIYAQASLGCVNFNWDGSLETFCCAATEMLACELPVLSFARGGLPETVGQSGGAYLLRSPGLEQAAKRMLELLTQPEELKRAGKRGRQFVLERYSLDKIASDWEKLLTSPDAYFRQIQAAPQHQQPWRALYLDMLRWGRPLGLDRLLRWMTGLRRKLVR